MFHSSKPYSAVSVQIEVLTSEQYEVDDSSGIPDLIEAVIIQGSGPSEASRALRKKLKYGNVHRQLRALTILDFLIQNSGDRFLREFADESLLERLRISATDPVSDPKVKEKCKQLFGQWAVTYKNTPGMERVTALYRQLPKRKQPANQAKAKVLRESGTSEEPPMGHTVSISAGNGPATVLSGSKHKHSSSKSLKKEKKEKRTRDRTFNLDREKPEILQTLASSSVASTNLLNALKLVNRETHRVSEDAEVINRFEKCKQLRRQVLRYIQHVESEEFLGSLIHANEELVDALMAFEVLDKSVDYDSDSDQDVLESGWSPDRDDRDQQSFAGLVVNPVKPPRPARPMSLSIPSSSRQRMYNSDSDTDTDEDDDEDNPFGDRNAIRTPNTERFEPSWCSPCFMTNHPSFDYRHPLLMTFSSSANIQQTPLLEQRNVNATVGVDPEPGTKQLALTLGSVWVGVFLAALDSTIVATLTGPISSSFHCFSLLSWLATAYLIANAACQPVSGRLTDIFSRRAGLIFCNIFFAAGNLVCGFARSESVMVLGRIVAGIGGGGLTAIGTIVTSDLVPLRQRGVWQGFGNICFGAGGALGGVFGGLINDTLGWRWAFLLQVPFIVVSGILVCVKLKLPTKETGVAKLKRVDFLGLTTLVVALVLLLLGLNTGGSQLPWTHPLVITSLSLSAGFLGVFVYIEARIASEPVIPVWLLLDRTVLSVCLTNWFTNMSVYGLIFYLPLFLQVQGSSATAAGARLIPQAIGTSVGGMASGVLMRATGRYQIYSYVSMALLVVSSALVCTLTFTSPSWLPFVYFFLVGLAFGGILTITLVALISAVDHDHHAVVTSASYAFRSTGSTIGITIASAVFQNVLKMGLWSRFGDREHAEELISRIRDNLKELKNLPPGLKTGALAAFMESLRAVFLTLLGLTILGTLFTRTEEEPEASNRREE
ncbi:major facilitator superfamily domain-containing protein [Aspergillus avenaceus]|uniref:Major facilitator superfamily domain-containing protein n=1 Tax=Aspergillus avenaceus TaxID=36643 RepID=A0A5N6TYC5_ASPAV|nr:major facilitator superfamily domain-containing protein [Aspergillus avenaceus]